MSIKLKYGALLGLVLVCLSGVAVGQIDDGADVWYTYTPTTGDDYILSLTQFFTGATVAIFNGDTIVNDPSTAAPVVHVEYDAPVELMLDADVPYYFRVAGLDQGGFFATGDYTIVLDKVEVSEGEEGEPVEGEEEGEPVEGEEEGEGEPAEGEPDTEEIRDNFDSLDTNGDGVLSPDELNTQLTNEQIEELDTNGDGSLDVCELGGAASITIAAPSVTVACEGDFTAAHETLAEAFAGVSVKSCDGAALSVASIVSDTDGPVDIDAIVAKLPEFGTYDGSIKKVQKLFQMYLLFQGGNYTVTYEVNDVEETQTISIGKECRGCLGCYSCDSCAGRRPIPDNVLDLKRLMSDWLLIGLSVMTLMSLSGLKKD